MATISLKDYHDQLQKWLKQNNTDRVIANSRHILQYYPKNVDTYRYLGQALTMTSQWQAAVKILRRVLGVHPDDYDAHAGLYEAYEELGQHDAALWHLERAFELNPNNADLISTLRQMYREHRGLNLRKIPLTYGAAARQFRASRLFPQAVDTLQDALVRNPDRADLRLLLAQVYWEAQRPVDAGEVALQVLEQLPDCFDANLIMTLLWLDEDRPADATPHLVSMEQVNPYRALEIVSGEVPADDEFMLEELDYQREAAQSVVVDDTAFLGSDFDFGTEEQDSPAETPEDTADASDFFASEIPDDWLDDDLPEPDTDGNTGDQQTGVLSRLTGPLPDLDEADANEDEFDFSEDEEDPFAFMGESGTGVTGMLEGNDEIDEDDPLDWMAQPGADNTDMPDEDTPTEAADNEDPLAWMQQSGTGVTGMLEDDEAEGEQAGTPLEEGGDPLQWMNTGDLPDKGQSGDVDPLAWMNDEDVELADGDSGELFDPAAAMAADNEGYQQGDDVDPLAWLETDHFNEEDAQAVPDIENEDIKDEAPVEDGDDADPLAWMNDEEFANTIEFGEAQTGPLSVEDSEPDTIPDWLAGDDAVLDEMLDVETLTTGDEDADLFAEFDDEDDAWLDDVDGTGDLDAVEDTPDEPADWLDETDIDAGEDAPTDDDDLAWLDDGETDADEADAPETSDFAWAEDDEADADSGLNWDDIDEGEFSGDAMTDTSDLSWMEDSNVDTSDLAGTMLFDQDDEDDAHPSDTVFDEDDLADDFDPPTGSLDFDEEDMDEAASDTDAFDTVADDIDDSTNWLQNLESKFEGGGENAEADTDSDLILDVGASDEAFDFGDEDPDTLDFDSPATDEFDFDDPSSDSPATDEFDFGDSSSEAADTDEFAEAEANADIDVDTDWLSNLGAQFDEDSDSAANVNPDTGLLFDVGEFDKDGGEDEDESPAWLADIDEEDDPLGPPTGDTSELLATGSTEEEGEFDISDDADAIADGEMPGWLADIRPDEGTAPLNNQPSGDTDQFAEDFDQAMAKFDDEEPEDEALLDWMTTPDDFDDSTTAQEGEAAMSDHYPEDNHEDDEQPDWLDDLNNDEEADPVAEDEQPDWLADLEPGDDKEEPADADFGATMMLDDEDDDLDDDDFAFGATFDDEDDAEPVDEDEQPDWLADLDEPDDMTRKNQPARTSARP